MIDGYKIINKETDKLIQQFNKKIDQIKKEQVAVDNLKAKYNQLVSGNKTPASLNAMESQLKKNEKEVANLQKQYDELINKMASNQTDLQFAKGIGDSKQIALLGGNQKALDEQSILLATQLENAKDKSEKLKESLKELKSNPQASIEVENLKSKIDLATSSVARLKNEANNIKNEIISPIGENGNDKPQSNQKNIGSSLFKNISKTIYGDKGINSGLDTITSKIDKFKHRMTRLISTIMVFKLLREALKLLSNGLISLLKTNDEFSNNLNQIKVNLLTAFAPIYDAVLPAINTLMNVLSKATGSIATFIASIFGQTATQAKKNAKSLYEQAKAQEALNESQENLASFDKLEVNNDTNSKGANNKGLDFSKEMQVNTKLLTYLNELRELASNGDWFGIGTKIASSLNKALANFDVKGFFEKGKQIAINIVEGINGFLNTFDFGLLAQKFSEAVIGMWDIIIAALVLFDWQGFGQAIGDFILGIDWWGVLVQLLSIISALFDAIIDLLIGLGTSIVEHIISWLPIVWEALKSIPGWINDNVLQPIWGLFKNIGESILLSLSAMWEGIKIGGQLCWDGIVYVWNVVTSWFYNTIIQPITNFFVNMWNSLVQGASNAWIGIQNVFSSVASFFGNTFSKAWQKVKEVFSTGGKVFDGIKEGILNAFKAIVNALITGINKIVSIPFNGLNSILQKVHDVSFLGITPFDWLTWRAPVPQIPMLAEGAVIPPNKRFTAVLGDQRNGTNLEAPENLIRKIVREESGGSKEIYLKNATFIMQLKNGVELGRTFVDCVRLVEDADGEPLFV